MSNLHSQQTGTQLHKPQKHTEAQQNSLLTKTTDNTVGYVEGLNSHSTVITPIADSGGSTNNKYFPIYSKQQSKLYAVWYNVNGDGSLELPDGYDELIEVTLSTGDTVETIIDNTVSALTTASSGENYVLFDSITDGVTDLTIVQTNTKAVSDGTTLWTFDTTTTASSTDKYLVSKATTGKLEFVDLASGSGDIESVSLVSDSGTIDALTGAATFTIAGGTGIETTATGSTLTIREIEEKKSKSDIDAVVGVTGTDLGTFTGSTIADSRDIKNALQDLETDHEVVKGTSYHHNSFRWSSFNLNGTTNTGGTNNGWVFYEPNNNKDMMFATACDTSDMSYQTAMKGCIETPITGVTSRLVGGSCLSSGELSDAYKITIWKADLDTGTGGGSGLSMTLMGTFSIAGSNNTDPDLDNIVLGSDADCTLADGDGVIVVMEDIETYTDHDTRGTISLRFEDVF